ncbi:hypothetical protein Echvi_4533 [Echinicola vietnamensis DSM 17526]|uniref:Uncharacterized protein n=1 Tax=Echinicola vietnamensis (strain DSM 17526 / LMG 23754 / KMM 6221) TaxID=926556 RepID=L0G6S2_ECHVK|nr:hypothetical protein Echvi_4533 [Echinicola vietnamensis DSM 17526]
MAKLPPASQPPSRCYVDLPTFIDFSFLYAALRDFGVKKPTERTEKKCRHACLKAVGSSDVMVLKKLITAQTEEFACARG